MASSNDQALASLKKKLRASGNPRRSTLAGLPCPHPKLSNQLPQGWPRGELTEILLPYLGLGELSLLASTLAALTHSQQWLAIVNPPYTLQASALRQFDWQLRQVLVVETAAAADALWATEQTLRSGVCAAVVTWLAHPSDQQLRRLQLAAERGASAGFVFRPLKARAQRSPAALRMTLQPAAEQHLCSTIIKHRGLRPPPPCELLPDPMVAL